MNRSPASTAAFPAAPFRAWPWLVASLLLVLVGASARILGWDRSVMLWAHATAASPLSAAFWSCLTIAGLGWAALILVFAADRGDGRLGALLVPAFLLGSIATHIPKRLFALPRPAATDLLPHLHIIGDTFRGSVSMPSGHSVTAAATAALLCLAVPRARWPLAVLAFAVAALIGASRFVVGAHWPSDVLVGLGLGLFTVWLCVTALRLPRLEALHAKFARGLRSRAGQHVIAIAELGAAAGLLTERTGYPAGVPMVVALALVALVSAACRWRALFESRPLQGAAATPVERT